MENNDHKKEGMAGEEMAMGDSMKSKGGCWHWACCALPVASLLMWLASVLFVILSWVSVTNVEGIVWGYGPQWWIWNAVMFGILAIYGGKAKMMSCRKMCGCKGGACVCK